MPKDSGSWRPFDKELRVAYFNADPKTIDTSLMYFEQKIKRLTPLSLTEVKSIEASTELAGFDLLLIAANSLEDQIFATWFKGLAKRMARTSNIWLPTLVMARPSFKVLVELLKEVAGMNWYFDIVDPDHVDSVPIRIANLLRIHDHLYELKRYEEMLSHLGDRVNELESEILTFKGNTF